MSLMKYETVPVGRLFDEFTRRLAGMPQGAFSGDDDDVNMVTSNWTPSVDIKEESDRFVVLADIPGVDPKDIEITMENGALTIHGERKSESDNKGEGWRRVERSRGTFYRRFALPDTADAQHIDAKSRDGVLEVTIPKREVAKPRRIAVQS